MGRSSPRVVTRRDNSRGGIEMKCLQSLFCSVAFSALSLFVATSSDLSGATPRPAVPIEPIAAILDAFRSHQVVALGEVDHGNEQGHAFRLSLIRDPGFANTVN